MSLHHSNFGIGIFECAGVSLMFFYGLSGILLACHCAIDLRLWHPKPFLDAVSAQIGTQCKDIKTPVETINFEQMSRLSSSFLILLLVLDTR